MDKNPYDYLGAVDWSKIERWELLDFVKALPDEVIQKLKALPPNAEIEMVFCHLNRTLMPRMNPENSRSFWLRYYNEQYEPIRAKNAQALEKETMLKMARDAVTFFKSTEEVLARMSSQMERIKQRLVSIDARIFDEITGGFAPWLDD
jgi:hypothetical protein